MQKFKEQYDRLGLKAPSSKRSPADKAEVIFHAAAKILGIDPAAGPQVQHLPEEFQAFPVAAFRLQVIREALVNRRKADWNNRQEDKWGSWFWMNDPGFRFHVSCYAVTDSSTAGGSRLCTFEEDDQYFFAQECITIWADFHGGKLPV